MSTSVSHDAPGSTPKMGPVDSPASAKPAAARAKPAEIRAKPLPQSAPAPAPGSAKPASAPAQQAAAAPAARQAATVARPAAAAAAGAAVQPAAPIGGIAVNDDQEAPRGNLFSRIVAPAGISMMLHLILLIALSIWMVEQVSSAGGDLMASTSDDDQLETLDVEDTRDVTVEIKTDLSADFSPLVAGDPTLTTVTTAPAGAGAIDGSDVTPTMLRPSGGGDSASFFGVPAKGKKFVYVVDNSKSMGGKSGGGKRTKFERAIDELLESIQNLSKDKQYYVVFFSKGPTKMFDPDPPSGMVAANSQTYYKFFHWVKTVELILGTKGTETMQIAIDMKPDAIYILGDGAFTDDVESRLPDMNRGKIPIHTLLFSGGKGGKGEDSMRNIANMFKGTFTKVD